MEAWTERFDHIDDHFMGRINGGPPQKGRRKRIELWVHPKKSVLGKWAGAEDGVAVEDAEEEEMTSDNDLEAERRTVKGKRRAGSEESGGKGRKRARRGSLVEMVYCVCFVLHTSFSILILCCGRVLTPCSASASLQPSTSSVSIAALATMLPVTTAQGKRCLRRSRLDDDGVGTILLSCLRVYTMDLVTSLPTWRKPHCAGGKTIGAFTFSIVISIYISISLILY